MPDMLKFDLPRNQSNIIKVIGVGGGGSNAVTHMYKQGIKGVDFIICNTDAQAMESSSVPVKVQLGTNLTSGLGAGAVPSVGRNAALEDADRIREILGPETKMVFITAGLGGGTGTGAAPVIAEISRERNILTVGIVTIPFNFEGRKRKQHADEGIQQLKEHVDALLIISNDKLRELYGNLRLSEAFGQADNVLTTAAKGIAEIITVTGYINVDFEDVRTVMKNSGVAIMGTGLASGENRALQAVEAAISSPLLNNNDIEGANNLLLYISSGSEEITMDEVTEITDYIHDKTKSSTEVIWGNGIDESLDDNISVTIIATGFDEDHRRKDEGLKNTNVTPLYGDPVRSFPTPEKPVSVPQPEVPYLVSTGPVQEPEPEPEAEPLPISTTDILENPDFSFDPEPVELPHFQFVAEEQAEEEVSVLIGSTERNQREFVFEFTPPAEPEPVSVVREEPEPIYSTQIKPLTVASDTRKEPFIPIRQKDPDPDLNPPELNKVHSDRVQKLKALSEKLKNHTPIENNLSELESIPAYKRRNVDLNDVAPSSESQITGLSMNEQDDKGLEFRKENSFLHKIVD